MRQAFTHGLMTSILIALVVLGGAAGAVAQVTPIGACGTLDAFGGTYNLTADLHACGGDCLVVANNRITVNLKGHAIVQDCAPVNPAASGVTDAGIARDQIVVRDGSITGFVFGVDLGASTRTEVRNIDVTDNDLDGIVVGHRAIVRDCLAMSNGADGILGKDQVQVQNCEASQNDANGIHVANLCLVTANTANDNLEEGIATGGRCTVSRNTASGNDDDGIDVGHDGEFDGARSLVTLNLTEGNFDDGIHVKCPSTVTNNTSTGNGLDYDPEGNGCVLVNNH